MILIIIEFISNSLKMKLFNLYYILAEVPGVARGKKILILKKNIIF